jgi:hypothetical protein
MNMSKNKPLITDTTKDYESGNLGFAGILPDGIEAIEARGQQELVSQRSMLPTEGLEKHRLIWEALGIQIMDPDPEDALFTEVLLPEGVQIQSSDHPMWSYLVDSAGQKRAGIFYKAAYYDRRAKISPLCRYSIRSVTIPSFEDDPNVSWGDQQIQEQVIDETTDSVVFQTALYSRAENLKSDSAVKEIKQWLEKNLPLYEDPSAYWE